MAGAFTSQYPDLAIDIDAELERYRRFANEIRPCTIDTVSFLHQAIRQGKKILVEGANATMLDIDFGKLVYLIKSSKNNECLLQEHIHLWHHQTAPLAVPALA